MTEEVQRNKARIAAVEEEYNNLPALAVKIINIIKLTEEQMKDLDTAKWRACFRMLQSKYILEALIRRSTFGDVEVAAAALGENVMEDLKTATDRLVGELLEMADRERRKKQP